MNLPPDVRARLRALRLYPRRARGSTGLGQHLSRSRGAGIEFAQYRAYEPGDEPRRIDWKLYARSDRHFVRESERGLMTPPYSRRIPAPGYIWKIDP